jgi:hypothetical protein
LGQLLRLLLGWLAVVLHLFEQQVIGICVTNLLLLTSIDVNRIHQSRVRVLAKLVGGYLVVKLGFLCEVAGLDELADARVV